jgi:hypothetical protein
MSEVEKDRYELDTSVAIANLQAMYDTLLRVEEGLRSGGEAAGGAEGAHKELAAGVFLGNLAFEAAKIAASAFYDAVKEGIAGVIAAERATAQLRVVAGEYTEALASQAEALEHLRGVSAEEVMASQAILLRFGVQAEKVDAVTRSILDYATATGTDLVSATQTKTRAVENGGGKIESLGIDLKLTGKAAADMAITAEALGKKFGGASAADSETMAGRAGLARVAFEDLQKAFGEMVLNTADNLGIFETLKLAIEGATLAAIAMHEAISGQESAQTKAANHLNDLLDKRNEYSQETLDLRTDLMVAEKAGDQIAADGYRVILEQQRLANDALDEEIAKLQHRNTLKAGGKSTPDRNTKAGDEDAAKAAEAAEKARAAELEAHEKAMARSVDIEMRRRSAEAKDKAAADKVFTDKELAEQKHLEAIAQIRKHAADDQAKIWERENARLMANAEKSRKAIESSFGKVLEFGEQALSQIAGLVEQPLFDFLTTNERYREEYTTATIERRRLALEEQGIIKTTAELRTEADKEATASQADRLSKTLASLAMEAGKQALLQVGEGIASLASYEYAAAGLHFAAAGAFGLLAGGAAAASYGVAQGRGNTTAERESLEAAQRKDAKKAERDSAQGSGGAKKKGDTVVTVYNLGITGQTRTAQARELNRIGAEYDGLVSLGGARP